jgi:hypothetical protein
VSAAFTAAQLDRRLPVPAAAPAHDPWMDALGEAWSLMGNQLDWTAMPYALAITGLDADPEVAIHGLVEVHRRHNAQGA